MRRPKKSIPIVHILNSIWGFERGGYHFSSYLGGGWVFKYIIKRIVNYVIMLFVAVSMTYFLASAFMDPRSNYMSRHPHQPIA